MRFSLSLCAVITLISLTSTVIADERPNFIFFITDDVSANDIGCYGSPVVKTPYIDAMADQGMKFTNATLAISSCGPSRCSSITGRYPHNTGACELHTTLPTDQFAYPQKLREAGYYTVLSGKNHMGNVSRAFDVINGGKGPGSEAGWVQVLKDRPKDQPFFCWFASTDAHRGWAINDEAPVYDPKDADVPPFLFDGPITRQDLSDYYHEVSRTDYFLGQLRAELERQGISDNTYIIYTSDNGRPFPRCKTWVYLSGIRPPFVMCGPTVPRGVVCDSLISSIDVAPTVLELAGVGGDPRLQGVSFTPLLDDPKAKVRDFAFAEHNWHVFQAHERMVRFGDWLYVRNAFPGRLNMCMESDASFPAGEELWDAHEKGLLKPEQLDLFQNPREAEMLFNVATDPYQLDNKAGNPEYAEVLKKLQKTLDRWTEETADSVPDDITNDRQDVYGKKNREHRRGTQPGTDIGSTTNNNKGPVLDK